MTVLSVLCGALCQKLKPQDDLKLRYKVQSYSYNHIPFTRHVAWHAQYTCCVGLGSKNLTEVKQSHSKLVSSYSVVKMLNLSELTALMKKRSTSREVLQHKQGDRDNKEIIFQIVNSKFILKITLPGTTLSWACISIGNWQNHSGTLKLFPLVWWDQLNLFCSD